MTDSIGTPTCARACDRRTFVARALGALAMAALPWGCATLAVTRVAAADGVVRLPPDHPALASSDGFLRIQPDGFPTPIYLLAGDDGWTALSPICTHQGCTVGVQGRRLVCPCHGSTYDREGRVLRGPAERSLRSFPVSVEPDGTIVITVEAA